MSEEGGKNRASPATGEPLPPNYYYGTFQGVANHPPPPPPQSQPVFGFPQPIPPPGASGAPPHYYPHGYQTVHGYAVAEGRPVREYRLPCCGMGIGWFLFISGFFLGTVPWYIGAFLLLCVRIDYREKPGLIACTLGYSMEQSISIVTSLFLNFFAVTMSAADYAYPFGNQAMLALIAVTFGVTKATHSW